MISSVMRLTMSDGIEKPTPIDPDWLELELPVEAIATLMPMSLPSPSTSAPPELPGLIAASVWMTAIEIVLVAEDCCWPWPKSNWNGESPCPFSGLCCVSSPSGAADEAIWIERFSALTMPVVTVLDSPSGAPTATVWSPTLSLLESPNVMGVSPDASSSLMTARS